MAIGSEGSLIGLILACSSETRCWTAARCELQRRGAAVQRELQGGGATARGGCGTGDDGRGLYKSFQFGGLDGGFLDGELEAQ